MPRKTPIPKTELEIGRRIREARGRRGAKRTEWAIELRISSDRLVSYEYGRVPLPWVIGDRICRKNDINQYWLVTGEDQLDGYLELSGVLPAEIDPRMRFSDVIQTAFSAQFRKVIKTFDNMADSIKQPADDLAKRLRIALHQVIREQHMHLTPQEYVEMLATTKPTVKFLRTIRDKSQAIDYSSDRE